MITAPDLRTIAAARLDDARELLNAGRFDGATYLCGYAVELALKARICDTLGWAGFPDSRKEFERYQSFKTHSLEVLLSLTGQEQNVKGNYLAEWSAVAVWDPESRYKRIGTAAEPETRLMINSAEVLLGVL